MEEDNEDDEDGEGEVSGRGRVAERSPTNEEDDNADPKDGAESTEEITQQFPDILRSFLGDSVLSITLKTTSCDGSVQTAIRGYIELLAYLMASDGVKSELLKELGIVFICILVAAFVVVVGTVYTE